MICLISFCVFLCDYSLLRGLVLKLILLYRYELYYIFLGSVRNYREILGYFKKV